MTATTLARALNDGSTGPVCYGCSPYSLAHTPGDSPTCTYDPKPRTLVQQAALAAAGAATELLGGDFLAATAEQRAAVWQALADYCAKTAAAYSPAGAA